MSSRPRHHGASNSSYSVIVGIIFVLGCVILTTSLIALNRHSGEGSGHQDRHSVLSDVRKIVAEDIDLILKKLPKFQFSEEEESILHSSSLLLLQNGTYESELEDPGMYTESPSSLSAVSDTDNNNAPVSSSRHPAAPDPSLEPEPTKRPLSCRESFEPTCDMYPYVRFWNKRFHEEDCYQSPLRHPLGINAPVEEQKYLLFEPDRGGWNNIRMAAEVAMIFAHATGRVLVMPPMMVIYLLWKNKKEQDNQSTFDMFFDLNKIKEALDIIPMEQFIRTVAAKGLLKAPLPVGARIERFSQYHDGLWSYLERACHVREWEPGKMFLGFNITVLGDSPSPLQLSAAANTTGTETPPSANEADLNELVQLQLQGQKHHPHLRQHLLHVNQERLRVRGQMSHLSTTVDIGGKTEDFGGKTVDVGGKTVSFGPISYNHRVELFKSHDRKLVPYDAAFHAEKAIYFPGDYRNTHRILTHFYSYLYFADSPTEHRYKRIVRDRLHYHDTIFCAAGRVVKLLHKEASLITGKPIPDIGKGHPKTLGGNINKGATYHSYHIRRGDFQYKETRMTAEQIWQQTRHLLDPTVTRLLYVATDEKNVSFFDPFREVFEVRFLHDYTDMAHIGNEHLNQNHIGMVEQVICANAHTFVGTPFSTFTGYITRMRGYYRDNRYENTFYSMQQYMYQLQRQPELIGPFWAREFSVAHHDIDDDPNP